LGIAAALSSLQYELYPTSADEVLMARVLVEKIKMPFVVIHPGSGDPRKLRPAAAWVRLIDSLDQSLQVMITGTKEERQLFTEIAAGTSRNLSSLMGELTVSQLYLLLQQAERVFALDSLAAHLGAAAGKPTTVFWSTTNDPQQWRPLGQQVTLLDSTSEAVIDVQQ
jgi:ADP-heptose:LPS heptosyltransferase